MAEASTATDRDTYRKKRVRRLKKMILSALIALLLLPILLCIFLTVRMNRLEKSVRELTRLVHETLETRTEANEDSLAKQAVGEDARSETDTEASAFAVSGEDSRVPIASKAGMVVTAERTDDKVSFLRAGDLEEQSDGIDGAKKRIYLTFDDGPSSYTNEILDILADYGVKATFFVVKKDAEIYGDRYRRIVEEGHSLGIHSSTHVMHTIYKSPDALMEDIHSMQDFLFEVTGTRTTLYRFPGGSSNSFIKKKLPGFLQAVTDGGYVYFDWNIDSKDADGKILTKTQVYNNVVKAIAKHDVCVILMHDAQSKRSTVDALPEILDAILKMDGAVILPITEGTNPVQHRSME